MKRKQYGYSLIETMTIIAVLGIVAGILYAYSNSGWKYFTESYNRGLSQVKAKLAVKLLTDDLREGNKERIYIGRGTSIGIPFPDDVQQDSPFIYFTKPVFLEDSNYVIGYDYVLYYFAKPKEIKELKVTDSRKKQLELKQSVLKLIKFKSQSKSYTEDKNKEWPFLPPILELQKSTLPEDDEYIETLKPGSSSPIQNIYGTSSGGSVQLTQQNTQNNNLLLDHFAQLKKVSRNIPISTNFSASALTDPFSKQNTSFFFGQDYKIDKTIKIKVEIEEPSLLFGVMAAKSSFEVAITPRN